MEHMANRVIIRTKGPNGRQTESFSESGVQKYNRQNRILTSYQQIHNQNRTHTEVYQSNPYSGSGIPNYIEQIHSQNQTHRSMSDKSVIGVKRIEIHRTDLKSESDV